ncbi:MFS transporter [Nocardioides sp.]|uniref:MFS transporter n=1 Tax=Nocardioides sp. TaxID=35761 RepID=UPI0039E4A36B
MGAGTDRPGAAFAALMAPAGLAILSVTFTRAKERGTAFGVYGAVSGAGVAIGLIVGGLLTEYTSWRWCPLVNVPVGVVALAIGLVVLIESRTGGRTRYDVPGAVTATLGLMSLIFATRLVPGMTVAAIGCGLVFVTAPESAMTDIADTDSDAASALVNTTQQIGGSLGLAVLGSIAASATTTYLTAHPGAVPAATMRGFHDLFLAGGLILVAGAVVVAVLIGSAGRHGDLPQTGGAGRV